MHQFPDGGLAFTHGHNIDLGNLAQDLVKAAPGDRDAMLVEAIGEDVYVVQGSAHSLKITTPTDLLLAEAMLQGPLRPRWVEG